MEPDRSGSMLSFFRMPMESRLHGHLDQIAGFCRMYDVRRLSVFGSILRGDFEPGRSDADFVVEVEPAPASVRMRNYLGLQRSLSALLARPVDLIEDGAIRNPYLLRNIEAQQQVLYAAWCKGLPLEHCVIGGEYPRFYKRKRLGYLPSR